MVFNDYAFGGVESDGFLHPLYLLVLLQNTLFVLEI